MNRAAEVNPTRTAIVRRLGFVFCFAVVIVVGLARPAHSEPPSNHSSPEVLRIAAGSEGDVYYNISLAIQNAVEDLAIGFEVHLVPTAGSTQSAEMMAAGDVELAIVQGNVAGEYLGLFPEVVGIASLYTEAFHILGVGRKTVETPDDLRGLRVFVGEEGSGTKEDSRRMLNILGVYGTEFRPVAGPFASLPELVENGEVDAAIIIDGVPTADIKKLRNRIQWVSLSASNINLLLDRQQYLVPTLIPRNTYPDQRRAIETVGVRALLVGSRSLDPALIENLLRAIHKGKQVRDICEGLGERVTPSNLARRGMPLPLHTGAEDYFRFKVLTSSILTDWLPDVLLLGLMGAFWMAMLVKRPPWIKAIRRNIYLRLIAIFFSVYVLATVVIHFAERNRTPGFENLPRAFWSTMVYVLSGLESREPRSPWGKVGLTILLCASVGMLGSITGKFASLFINIKSKHMPSNTNKHILICNWNERGDGLVREIHSSEAAPDTDIVVLTHSDPHEEELRQASLNAAQDRYGNVYFVRGNPQLHDVLRSANAHQAKCVVILMDPENPDPDANAALIGLAIRRICEEANIPPLNQPHLVAESLNHRKIRHIKDAGVNEVICASDYGLGVLAQCTLNKGLSEVYDRLLHFSEESNEIYVIEWQSLPSSLQGASFQQMARTFAATPDPDNPCIPIGIQLSDGTIKLNPRGGEDACVLSEGDSLIVIAFTTPNLSRLASAG